MSRLRFAAVFFGLVSFLGCAGTLHSEVEPPEVYLSDIAPVEIGLFEQRLRVELRILNPNDFALEVTGLDFQLDVNGIQLARGLSNEEITVPRLGESIVSVMTSTTVLDIVRQIENLSQQQEMSYEIRGRLYLGNTAVGSVPFERSAKYAP
ncbi:MAG: LEA type 2 family protein [candidate division NC10 bacterium]